MDMDKSSFFKQYFDLDWGLIMAGALFVVSLCILVAGFKQLILPNVKPGEYPLRSMFYLRKWTVDRLVELSLTLNNAQYGTLYLAPFLRMLGAQIVFGCVVRSANIVPTIAEAGSVRPVMGSLRRQSAGERRPYRPLLAPRHGDRRLCGDGRRGLALRAQDTRTAAASARRHPYSDWAPGLRRHGAPQSCLRCSRRAHAGYFRRGATPLCVGRYRLYRTERLLVLRLRRAGHRLSRCGRLRQAWSHDEARRRAVRYLCPDGRISARVRMIANAQPAQGRRCNDQRYRRQS